MAMFFRDICIAILSAFIFSSMDILWAVKIKGKGEIEMKDMLALEFTALEMPKAMRRAPIKCMAVERIRKMTATAMILFSLFFISFSLFCLFCEAPLKIRSSYNAVLPVLKSRRRGRACPSRNGLRSAVVVGPRVSSALKPLLIHSP